MDQLERIPLEPRLPKELKEWAAQNQRKLFIGQITLCNSFRTELTNCRFHALPSSLELRNHRTQFYGKKLTIFTVARR